MVSINGFMRETQLGRHTISVHILLHNTIFIQSILFNAQAWSNMTERNMEKITSVQLKFLKKIMGVKQATTNSFTYLEMGVMPIKYEFHKRQLSFLHHIIHLSEDDPVQKLWKYQASLPDYSNWWSGVKKLMAKYTIVMSEEEIKEMSKDSFKRMVKLAVKKVAFEELRKECRSKEKTEKLVYDELKTQEYLTKLCPSQSKLIFKCRSKTLNIKEHMQYKYRDNNHCRWCGVCDETLGHIINCGYEGEHMESAERIVYGTDVQEMSELANRIEDFLERVEV